MQTAEKENCPSRKTSTVTLRDEIECSPKKFDTNEQKTLPIKKESPAEDDLHSCSSSLSIDANSTSVVDKERQVSVLERYSDDSESKDTSCEFKSINMSVASLETNSVSLSETKENGEPFVTLDEAIPRSDGADKTIRSWLTDPRLYMVSARRDKIKTAYILLNVYRKRAHQAGRVFGHGNSPIRVFLFWSEAGKFKICNQNSEKKL